MNKMKHLKINYFCESGVDLYCNCLMICFVYFNLKQD